MSNDSDNETICTMSEMNSVHGNMEAAKYLAKQREEQRSYAIPKWIINERLELIRRLDMYNQAFDKAERLLLFQKSAEDAAESFEARQTATETIECLSNAIVTSSRELKEHILSATTTLNECIANLLENRTIGLCEEIEITTSFLSVDLPIDHTLPSLEPGLMQLCDKLVGKLDLTENGDGPGLPPCWIVIHKHDQGFFREDHYWGPDDFETIFWRPDGAKYKEKGGTHSCVLIEDELVITQTEGENSIRRHRYSLLGNRQIRLSIVNYIAGTHSSSNTHTYIIDRTYQPSV